MNLMNDHTFEHHTVEIVRYCNITRFNSKALQFQRGLKFYLIGTFASE